MKARRVRATLIGCLAAFLVGVLLNTARMMFTRSDLIRPALRRAPLVFSEGELLHARATEKLISLLLAGSHVRNVSTLSWASLMRIVPGGEAGLNQAAKDFYRAGASKSQWIEPWLYGSMLWGYVGKYKAAIFFAKAALGQNPNDILALQVMAL